MKKTISFVGLFAVIGVGISDAHGVAMSAQVRRLLQEKQEKIEQLEKCEGKKQGWMIAGISTIGLTAVGVGVNIAQASKSNRLSSEIEMEKSTLERHQNELNRITSQISDLQVQQNSSAKAEHTKQAGVKNANNGESEFGSKSIDEFITNLRSTYSDISVKCGDNYTYVFIPGDEKTDDFARIKQECVTAGGDDFVRVDDRTITINDKSQNVDLYQCKAEWRCEETKNKDVLAGNQNKIPELSPISAGVLKSNLISDDKLPPREIPKVSSDIRIANNSDENVGTVDNIMELARYRGYKVQCNGADEKFEFVNNVPGADEQILRIKTECNGKITEKTSSMQYTGVSGKTTDYATTIIICKCDKRRDFSVSESGIKKLSSGTSGGTLQESKWHILEQADRGYGVTRDYFCNQVQDKSKYIAFTVRADYPNVSALIEHGAGMGYWCKQLDGTWTVMRPYGINGREWKCDNLDAVKSQCNEKLVIENNKDIELQIPSWFSLDELQSPARDPNYWTQQHVCENITFKNDGFIGLSTNLLTLKDKYEYALGMGYWCQDLGGKWLVSVSEDGSLVEWKCDNLDAVKSKCNS